MPGMWQWCCCNAGNSLFVAWADTDGQVVLAEKESSGDWRYENVDNISNLVTPFIYVVINKAGRPVVVYTDGTSNRFLYASVRVGDYGEGFTSPVLICQSASFCVAADTQSNDIYVLSRNLAATAAELYKVSTTSNLEWTASSVYVVGRNIVVDSAGYVHFVYRVVAFEYVTNASGSYVSYSMTTAGSGF